MARRVPLISSPLTVIRPSKVAFFRWNLSSSPATEPSIAPVRYLRLQHRSRDLLPSLLQRQDNEDVIGGFPGSRQVHGHQRLLDPVGPRTAEPSASAAATSTRATVFICLAPRPPAGGGGSSRADRAGCRAWPDRPWPRPSRAFCSSPARANDVIAMIGVCRRGRLAPQRARGLDAGDPAAAGRPSGSDPDVSCRAMAMPVSPSGASSSR